MSDLRTMLETATDRLAILLDRMEECNNATCPGQPPKHELSVLVEGPRWIAEQRAVLGAAQEFDAQGRD